MLILASGPSGVGKTIMTRELVKQHQCQYSVVPTYTTRDLRADETEKVSISNELFLKMQSNNDFFCIDNFYGNYYGIPTSEVEKSVKDRQRFFVIDRPIWKWKTFDEFTTIKIIVLPESLESLISRVNQCGRSDRLPLIIDDFENNYKRFYQEEIKDPLTFVVVNREFKAEETASAVHSFISQQVILP